MSKFSEWLCDNYYTSSSDLEICQTELSSAEMDVLYQIYVNI